MNDIILLEIFFAGVLVGSFIMLFFYTKSQKKLKEYQRKLEKTSVQSCEDNSRVGVLEAKIQTLEKALQAALNKEN